jgi:hypothetical protein
MSSVFVPVKQPLLLVMRANSGYRTTSEESESISAVQCMVYVSRAGVREEACRGVMAGRKVMAVDPAGLL